MASLEEMRAKLEVKRAKEAEIIEASVVEEGEGGTYDPELELTTALALIQDSVKLFEDVLDPKRKGKINKFLIKNIEDLHAQLLAYMNLYEDEVEEEETDDWEVAFLKNLGHPINGDIAKTWRCCAGCGGWGNKWEKLNGQVKCGECVKEMEAPHGMKLPKCCFCGKKEVQIFHGDIKSCRPCYKQFEKGEVI